MKDIVEKVLEEYDFPINNLVLYASAREGYASINPDDREGDLKPLFDKIVETPINGKAYGFGDSSILGEIIYEKLRKNYPNN